MPKPDRCLVGIDIGSSKIGVLIGKRDLDGEIEIIGQGEATNRGTRRGNVVNVEVAVESLRQAVEEAEMMAGHEIESAYVGVGGFDIRSFNSRGMVAVTRKDREIRSADIDRVLEAAQSAALPSDREILHAIPQEFIVDDQGGIVEPQGMSGSRLEVAMHLVTGHLTRSKTVLACVNKAGIRVRELVFEPLANGFSVLRADEREVGTLLIDLGADTSGYGFFADGEIQHSGVCPVGASHFTNDLAQVLRTPFDEAEQLKLKRGACLESLVGDEEGISVPSIGGGVTQVVRRKELCQILQPRAEELFSMIHEDLVRVGRDDQVRNVVLTGGGAQLVGLLELAQMLFNTAVRYGVPEGYRGLTHVIESPSWATAAGLLRYARVAEDTNGRRAGAAFSVRSVLGNLKGMFADLL